MPVLRLSALGLPAVVALVLALPAASSQGQKPALSVTIASPAGGATLRGSTRFSVRVRGLRPERVDFYLNGRPAPRRPAASLRVQGWERAAVRAAPGSEHAPRRGPPRQDAGRGPDHRLRRAAPAGARLEPAEDSLGGRPRLLRSALPRLGQKAGANRASSRSPCSSASPSTRRALGRGHQHLHGGRARRLDDRDYHEDGDVRAAATRRVDALLSVGDNRQGGRMAVTDECDMGLGGCDGKNEYENLAIHARAGSNQLRAKNDGRFLQANFGNGVLGTFWARNTMRQFVRALDVSSVDKYAYTSPHNWESAPDLAPLAAAARRSLGAERTAGCRRMRTFQDPKTFSRPGCSSRRRSRSSPSRAPHDHARPDRRGGLGCDHSRGARHRLLPAQQQRRLRERTRFVDCGRALRKKLSRHPSQDPVPRSRHQHAVLPVRPPRAGPTRCSRPTAAHAYIFAASVSARRQGRRRSRFPRGVKGATVVVEGEGRTLPVWNRRFTDSFRAESSHHVYRVSLADSR